MFIFINPPTDFCQYLQSLEVKNWLEMINHALKMCHSYFSYRWSRCVFYMLWKHASADRWLQSSAGRLCTCASSSPVSDERFLKPALEFFSLIFQELFKMMLKPEKSYKNPCLFHIHQKQMFYYLNCVFLRTDHQPTMMMSYVQEFLWHLLTKGESLPTPTQSSAPAISWCASKLTTTSN